MDPPQNLHVLRVNHRDKLTDALESMYHEEELCDVTICCDGGQLVKAHRVILAACSQYFKQIFSCTTAGQYPIVFLKSITIEDLKAILEFVYKGEVTVPPGQIESLIGSAETLGVTGLGKINLHEQGFVVNENGSSASSSPLHNSETNGKLNTTQNTMHQSAQVEIQKSVPIQALPKKRGKKRKIRDEPKVEAQIVKASVVQPTLSTQSASKSSFLFSSLVRASSSSSKLTKSIPPVAQASHFNDRQNMAPPSVIPSSSTTQQEMVYPDIENVEYIELDDELEDGHRVIQLVDEDHEQNRVSNSDAQAQVPESPEQPNITSNGSLDLSQHSTRSDSVKQPSRKPSATKSAPVRPVLKQPNDTKPVVLSTISPYIKMESRPRGRPRKLITANAAVVPRPLNPLIGLARSSLAGKIAAAAAAAAGSQISPTGSPVSQALMTPPPPEQAQIMSTPTLPPLRITLKSSSSSTPTVTIVNSNGTPMATANRGMKSTIPVPRFNSIIPQPEAQHQQKAQQQNPGQH